MVARGVTFREALEKGAGGAGSPFELGHGLLARSKTYLAATSMANHSLKGRRRRRGSFISTPLHAGVPQGADPGSMCGWTSSSCSREGRHQEGGWQAPSATSRDRDLNKAPELFATTPPTESLKYRLRRAVQDMSLSIMYVDAARAYLYAVASPGIYAKFPAEARQAEGELVRGAYWRPCEASWTLLRGFGSECAAIPSGSLISPTAWRRCDTCGTTRDRRVAWCMATTSYSLGGACASRPSWTVQPRGTRLSWQGQRNQQFFVYRLEHKVFAGVGGSVRATADRRHADQLSGARSRRWPPPRSEGQGMPARSRANKIGAGEGTTLRPVLGSPVRAKGEGVGEDRGAPRWNLQRWKDASRWMPMPCSGDPETIFRIGKYLDGGLRLVEQMHDVR